jgi:glucokinase
MRDGPVALGIDVGGTKVALVLLDGAGEVLAERRLRNRDHPNADALLDAVAREALAMAERSVGVRGVGVGICELVSPSGTIESSATIPWSRSDLEQALGTIGPLTVEADVRAAARAEAVFGSARTLPSFGYVTIGTGISSTFVRDGEPWAGVHGAAQLLGSARIDVPCPHCGREVDLCLEDVASGAGILRRFREGREVDAGGVDVSGVDGVIEAARAGDADADRVISEAANALGSFLALFVNLFDPGTMVLGGGLALEPTVLIERTISTARSSIWAPHVRSTPIVLGALGANAGAIGAAWLILAHEMAG